MLHAAAAEADDAAMAAMDASEDMDDTGRRVARPLSSFSFLTCGPSLAPSPGDAIVSVLKK